MTWAVVGIFGAFALGVIGLLTWMISHLETSLGRRLDRFELTVDTRFSEVNRRFDVVDQRFDLVDQRFDLVDRRLHGVEGRLDRVEGRLDRVTGRLDHVADRLTSLEGGFRDLRADLTDHIAHHSA